MLFTETEVEDTKKQEVTEQSLENIGPGDDAKSVETATKPDDIKEPSSSLSSKTIPSSPSVCFILNDVIEEIFMSYPLFRFRM